MVKTHNKPNQRPQIQLLEQGRLVSTEQLSSSSAQEIHKRVSLDCDSTNRTGRPVSSCVPVSVERLEKDKDATERPVGCEQSIDLFTQRDEIDIDFRVSGIAACSCETSRKLQCSRTREEDRESSSSTSASSRIATK